MTEINAAAPQAYGKRSPEAPRTITRRTMDCNQPRICACAILRASRCPPFPHPSREWCRNRPGAEPRVEALPGQVWKADEQVERGHSHPDEQARPFIILKNQTPIEERVATLGHSSSSSSSSVRAAGSGRSGACATPALAWH
ncbi:hypothetical protein MC885_016941 [Smutsia gigantea]|nr:hypothetical protein MC885_016941 [Smutsia gigantea]